MLLQVSLDRQNGLVIIALVNEVKSDVLRELCVQVGVISLESILRPDLPMDKLLFQIS